jgi:hypothetical protein
MIYGTITAVIFILGFAYIILASANKESGNMKLAGQIIAVLVALAAVVVLYCGSTGQGCCGMRGRGMMGGCMMEKGKENPKMMDMMKSKGTKPMMHKKTAK